MYTTITALMSTNSGRFLLAKSQKQAILPGNAPTFPVQNYFFILQMLLCFVPKNYDVASETLHAETRRFHTQIH